MEENHEWIPGVWCPERLFRALESKQITTTEFALVLVIDGFHHSPDGCYASNRYLGERIGIKTPNRVGDMISKLKNLGLVEAKYQTIEDNKTGLKKQLRFLQSPWMREGTKGKKASLLKGSDPPLKKGGNSNKCIASVLPNGKNASHTFNGFGLSKDKVPSLLRRYCERFKEVLKRYNMTSKWHIDKQFIHFRALRNEVGKTEFKSTFNWYCDNAGKPGPDGREVPIFSNPQIYCQNYNWVKRLRDMDPEYEPPENNTGKEVITKSQRSVEEIVND